MTQTQPDTTAKKFKQKNWAVINGSCKMAKLSDGLAAKPCAKCELVHKLRECPFCRTKRGEEVMPLTLAEFKARFPLDAEQGETANCGCRGLDHLQNEGD